jgi:cell division protein FtsB
MTKAKRRPVAKPGSRGGSAPIRSNRARLVLFGSVLLAAAILAAWFPAEALLHQRSSLASASAQLRQLHAQEAALAVERKNLNAAAEISRIAREQYQLISPGQQPYQVLPPAGTSGGTGLGPVASSSAGVLPSVGSITTTTLPHQGGPRGTGKQNATPQEGTLARMLHALEFWR